MCYSDLGGQEVSESFVNSKDQNEIQQDLPGATQSVVSLLGVMRTFQDAIQAGPGAGMLFPWTLTWGLPPFRESSSNPLGAELGTLRKSPDETLSPLP